MNLNGRRPQICLMEDDLNFFEIEDDLNFFQMEDNPKEKRTHFKKGTWLQFSIDVRRPQVFINGRWPQVFINGRWPQFFYMEILFCIWETTSKDNEECRSKPKVWQFQNKTNALLMVKSLTATPPVTSMIMTTSTTSTTTSTFELDFQEFFWKT